MRKKAQETTGKRGDFGQLRGQEFCDAWNKEKEPFREWPTPDFRDGIGCAH